ncbi:phage holin family protein [Ramlibacter sp. H39-3-26]|uniref:phage holin family protein n=1 Tax=Curvibacter soli TaxID=3031331 RepID=UPI0023DBE747|nr:phage holin family protein [Ramlibacter sp. H39-3-26]MDF1485246.1 phage holin family protein [Ramlibacter sp. H39-3-26]
MNWRSLLGLDDWAACWHKAATEGAIALEDRVELACLEWQDQKRRLCWLLVLSILGAGLTVVALTVLSLAVLVQFWDTPQRATVAWVLGALWTLAWLAVLAALAQMVRRSGAAFALTRRELSRDWQALKESL